MLRRHLLSILMLQFLYSSTEFVRWIWRMNVNTRIIKLNRTRTLYIYYYCYYSYYTTAFLQKSFKCTTFSSHKYRLTVSIRWYNCLLLQNRTALLSLCTFVFPSLKTVSLIKNEKRPEQVKLTMQTRSRKKQI